MASASQVRPHVRAFAVEFVANEAGLFHQFMSGLQIRLTAAQNHRFLRRDDFLLVGVGGADAANAALETAAKLFVIRMSKGSNGADRRGRKVARGDQLSFSGGKQIARPT